jgi:GTPase SAR1 family protein
MMTQDEYRAKYVKDKDRLLSFIGKTKEKFDNFNFNNNLDELKTNVVSNNFSIVVIGEFSSGKSTFLNALMGERYLPSYKRETTATINYLKHKDLANNGDKCLVITYNDGRKEELNLSFEAIQKYTTTDDKDKIDVAKEIKYIEIFIDSKFLKDNTMLVDTPGLNGIEEGLLDITMNQISKSHSCIYLFNSNAPGTKTDFDVLNDLNKKFNSILIVLNQIDQIKEDEGETVDSIINTLKINFKKQIPDAKIPEIFPLSSLAALVARHPRDGEVNMPGDKKKYSSEERKNLLLKSRIEEFESRLWRFLTQGEKTRNEILEPLKKLKEIINQKLIDLKEENEALENKEDTAELQKEIERYEDEVKNISEDFNNQKKQITSIVEDKIENSK